ncbi:MAG: alpha-amylase [Rhodothermales bacterium]|nr:alpha-amylase [Rhodothermales bacterium]
MSFEFPSVKCVLLIVLGVMYAGVVSAQSVPFTWDNATVYFVMTDRFANGRSDNDAAYGRGLDGDQNPYAAEGDKKFVGGDFAGLTSKLNEGYFENLGIDAIWISPPFEQIHGWVAAPGGREQSYAYHGYWLLDPTELDANFGTPEEFRQLVDTAHSKGVRVIVDIVINHPGYATMADMDEFGFGELDSLWRGWRPSQGESWNSFHDKFVDYSTVSDSTGWADWWGPAWIRAGLSGHDDCGSEDLTLCLSALPDFKTDSADEVEIPQFLLNKWGDEKARAEMASLDAYFQRTGYRRTPVNYLIKWATDLVREFGIDGYRIDTAKHVESENWYRLISEATSAHREFWSQHEPPAGFQPMPFWTVGEIYGLSPGMVDNPADIAFDAYINFELPYRDLLDVHEVDSLYLAYSNYIGNPENKSFLSYVSSHDEGLADRTNAYDLATRFVMMPGAIQLLFGDELSRGLDAASGDRIQLSRTPIDWESLDEEILTHWQKLLQFRQRHPAIGAGGHEMIESSPHIFRRSFGYGTYRDEAVIVIGAKGRTRINVSKSFGDDSLVRDAYSGKTSLVTFGFVTLTADPSGIMLLEEAN